MAKIPVVRNAYLLGDSVGAALADRLASHERQREAILEFVRQSSYRPKPVIELISSP
jgi:hypothetical protein